MVAGALGFAVNDSGVAIPAMMIAMVVPWLLLLPVRGRCPTRDASSCHVVVGRSSSAGWAGARAAAGASAAPVFLRRNYRGADVATASGMVIVLAVRGRRGRGRGLAAAGWSGDVAADAGRSAMLVAAVGFGFLGLLDDLAGTESGGGFRRHLRRAARRPAHHRRREAGRRGAGGGGRRRPAGRRQPRAGCWSTPPSSPWPPTWPTCSTGRPGRTIKVGVVAFAVLAAVDGATAVLAGPGVAVGAGAALAGPDLQERAMLGDTGANVLGAAVGLAAVLVLDHPATRGGAGRPAGAQPGQRVGELLAR